MKAPVEGALMGMVEDIVALLRLFEDYASDRETPVGWPPLRLARRNGATPTASSAVSAIALLLPSR